MQDKARIYSFATKKTDYQALVDDPWFLDLTDTVYVTGGYLEYLGQSQVTTSSHANFSLGNDVDGYIGDFDGDDFDEEDGDLDTFLIDTIVTIDTGGILREPLKIQFLLRSDIFPAELRREKPGISTNMPGSPLLVSRKNLWSSRRKQLLEIPLSKIVN